MRRVHLPTGAVTHINDFSQCGVTIMILNLTRKSVPIAALVAALMGSAAVDLRAQNLVQNPGFEAGNRGTFAVDNWSVNLNNCTGVAGDPAQAPGIGRTYAWALGPLTADN